MDLNRIDETALNAFNVGGKQYGLPGNFSNVVLVYNKDLFDQAGLDYPTNDWTQDDVQAAAEAIRALGDDIYGIYQPVTYNEFYKVAAQYGGQPVERGRHPVHHQFAGKRRGRPDDGRPCAGQQRAAH